MKDTLSYIVGSIVNNKDKVKIDEEIEGDLVTLKITVDKDDMGRIIGKNGKIIKAIRNVMKIPAIKKNIMINVMLEEILA